MSPGQGAKHALNFLKTFYRDLHSMMMACEQQMAEQGWRPSKSSQIAELSNSLHRPKQWYLDSVFRSYLPSASEGARDAVVLLVLLNIRYFEEAQVLAVRARFGKNISHKRIWHRWTNGTRILDHLTTGSPSTELPEAVYRDGALPDASSAHGFLVPLDQLSDEEAVRTQLIQRVLALP